MGDRWVLVGITRSGKTTLAKALIHKIQRMYPGARIYIIDSKWKGGDFEAWPGIYRGSEAPDPIRAQGGTLVWQSPVDDVTEYDAFLKAILKAGDPAFLYIDELSSLGGNSGQSYPIGLAMLLKQGAGLGIGAAISTQELAYMPRQVLNQATHYVRFPLEDEYDSRRIDKRLKRPREEWGIDPDWYSFYYRRNQGRSKLHLFKSYRELLGE